MVERFVDPESTRARNHLTWPASTALQLLFLTSMVRSPYLKELRMLGTPSSTYNVQVTDIPGISTAVESNSLTFTKYGEERTFKVTFTCKENVKPKDYVFGELT